MFDANVQSLVRAVADGDVSQAAPLLDRLEELGDCRRHDLTTLLGYLVQRGQEVEGRRAEGPSRRQSPEMHAARLDERCWEAWSGFARDIQRLFWVEFSDEPVARLLDATSARLTAPKQAARLKGQAEATDEDHPMEESAPPRYPMGANPSNSSHW